MRVLKQSTAYNLTVFMADSTDHVTGKTGLTLTITASKDGAAFASITPTVTELATGWYKLALTTSHTDTLGDLALHITGTGADPTDVAMQVRANVLGDTLPSNVTQYNGVNATSSSGRPEVNTTHLAGTSQTARDIGASVLLSSGTGTGQLDITSGVAKSNLAQILGTALTETSGLLAGGFKKFFNVAAPTGTVNSLPDAVAGASGGVSIVGSNMGTVTSVTGNVGGNVVGSVASVTAGVIVTTNNDKTGYTASTVTDKTGYSLTSAYDAAKTAAQAGDAMALTTGERTSTATAVWASSTRTLSSFGTLVADIWTAVVDSSGVTTLLGRLTNTRADNLDNLDATVSSRLASSSYTVPPSASTNASAVRTELATELGRVDASVSSRLASASYAAPLDAAGTRTAVGLASANLDTQLAGIADDAADAKVAAEGSATPADVEASLNAATSEPTSALAANASLRQKVSLLFALGRNKLTSNGATGVRTLYADDGTTPIATASDTDSGGDTGTLTRGELS